MPCRKRASSKASVSLRRAEDHRRRHDENDLRGHVGSVHPRGSRRRLRQAL